jgi:hypothetical protein
VVPPTAVSAAEEGSTARESKSSSLVVPAAMTDRASSPLAVSSLAVGWANLAAN